MTRDHDSELRFDDVADDAAAAYRELAEKGEGSPAPEREPEVREPVRNGHDPDSEEPEIKGETDQAGEDAASRKMYPPRAKDGKFAKRADGDKAEAVDGDKDADAAAKAKDDGDGEKAPADGQDGKEDTGVAPGAPPPSWSVKSKAEWDKLPQHFKDDIIKREGEVAQGLSALRDYKDLKPWAEMASKHGTSIGESLKRYVGMENLLKQDLGKGLAVILQNYGYSQDKAATLFSTLAQKYGAAPANGAQPAADGKPTGDPLIDALRPVLQPIMDEVAGLKTHMTEREKAQVEAAQRSQRDRMANELSSAISEFSADPANRFYPDLEETITRLFETGMVPLTGNHKADLRKAYETAAQMHPEVNEALIEQRLATAKAAERKKEQEAADKAKLASRSVTGSRPPGTVTRERQEGNGHDDVEADVRAAFRLHQSA